ncbi:remorin [Populus alba]|uniref:DNA-binding family protein n=2 Tax=Populus TaxID=3689 RepID=A0A4U5QU82_POPAL|nr:remorin-like [Populus alba]KAJ6972285.1 remorin-like [Populus alba x Populus x berolinensis]TKS14558.1 DNA-binding family protein [Populus alba]
MAEQEVKKVETETPVTPAPVETKSDVADEKAIVPTPPAAEEKEKVADELKALAVVEKTEPAPKKISGGSIDRDIALADLEKEKRLSFIKAWEDSEKTKAENKSQKKLSAVVAWENSKKAALEATLRKMEEKLEKQKAEYAEKMKNKVALIHKEAEEKRAMVEAKRGEELLKAEEMAAKYRATGQTPKKLLGCF